MHRRKLPIGIQTFREIREDDYYYVDKTGFALRLIEHGKYYFLSRPRRFGKSLLLDTLAELFSANEPLFRGLLIHPAWDWSTTFPVIRISFAEGVLHTGLSQPGNAQRAEQRLAQEVELAPEGRALQQIKDRGYADKYRAADQPIHLVGIEFSREQRNLVGFEVENQLRRQDSVGLA